MWDQVRPDCPASIVSCSALAIYVTGYRLMAIGFAGLSGWLIYRITQHGAPRSAPAALLIWLWNPVMLISSALGAHNDGLMLVLLLAMLYAVQQRRWLAGLLLLGLAAHIKLTALLFAPALVIWLIRRAGWRLSIRAVLSAGAILIPVSWLLYAPLGGWQTLPRMLHERGLYFANGPAAILYRWLYEDLHWPWPQAVGTTNLSATIGFGLALILLLWRFWQTSATRPATDESHWRVQALIMMAYLVIGSFWFQHWYVVWALIVVALIPTSAIARSILPWYGFGALCANIAVGIVSALPGIALGYKGYAILATAIIFIPLAVALAWAAWRPIVSHNQERRAAQQHS